MRAGTLHGRVWYGLRHLRNWLQLGKFAVVGASGYVVNLACFALALHYVRVHHLVAATWAFLVAVVNNFLWNRGWTFGGLPRRRAAQALRFLTVSVVAFLFSAALLEVLVSGFRVPALMAQGVSIAAATPLSFIGNKLWTFKVDKPFPGRRG